MKGTIEPIPEDLRWMDTLSNDQITLLIKILASQTLTLNKELQQ